MKLYRVWLNQEGGRMHVIHINAVSVGRMGDEDSSESLQFLGAEGEIVAEVDTFDGWALDSAVVSSTLPLS